MARRKHKPSDPAEAARRAYETRRNPAAWGTNDAALSLPSNSDVGSIAATREKTRRVQRFDCFATLKLSDHQFNAVRRYQADLAESYGVGDAPQWSGEVVDGGAGAGELVTARMIAASNRCSIVYREIGHHDRTLLVALSLPVWVEGKAVNWKATVKRLRGLIDRDSQAQAVKTMAEAVRAAYAEIDNGQQRKAA